ncbi:DUF402 domain-containing protein [Hydrogenibacillus schlegelii]|uniref:Cysteinyl-tRNA synthetase related protein n=1 Tax=Hydrogenibacillus schlegelii TaxID=1484 RepID=A0A132MGU5_HYDSH|nr:DUF402 domain-containing protein [Hydrogenibacillus schlegelii]KWW97062.1 hypothetical protein TR75_10435 [Hydrogenibacillus schlegelii]MBE3563914.1 DUF402 domain-containing protein [Hydrogenibacillus schlegelii]MBT9281599.1 DUF402 domain-containing protein [Hydrogenibacillus schlegelii]OAR03386.1 hypothetical protein SA87_01235 [Hydrogenibacillus schlegelii]PTQ51547.1 MAG: Cysteinyl-tRNA synthetase related protein [Hydrogenibacillus schlegelii]
MHYRHIGDRFDIESYKYDGKLHRRWSGNLLLADGRRIICGNDRVAVTEADGTTWTTREPAICFFDRREWFNVIAMLREDGVHFYCNISTPAEWRRGTLTYVDLDLDVRVTPDGEVEVLDKEEFRVNRERYAYPLKVVTQARRALGRLLRLIQARRPPFDPDVVHRYHARFVRLVGS